MEIDANCEVSSVSKDRRSDALGDLSVLPDEILCGVLVFLSPRDVGRLSCVSSVMCILCNEEPLWMSLCLNNANRLLQYKGSWKKSTLHELDLLSKYEESCRKTMHFDGFHSLFLYRRLYRCYTRLDGFTFDHGNVERRTGGLSLEEFCHQYDGQKPVLISGLADAWSARNSWTPGRLSVRYGDTPFRISQRSSRKISMKLKDYVSYMQIQHDEDPLYIFDDKFGEVEPDLLKDYSVPHLFQEDYFDVLDRDQRPAFRWLIIGPERSGASWHVDPALTSAWNTLLYGRKRWALYPPGRVPVGVTVHVNDEDGDVNIDSPSSLQWWLEFYPHLADEDKPIECTQLPGETIFVPSGWWHCVLNLETTVAVTQNFVNSMNFEFVCLDLAPGYLHKGASRAGLLAIDKGSFGKSALCEEDNLSSSDVSRKKKRPRIGKPNGGPPSEIATNDSSKSCLSFGREFSYDVDFLALFLEEGRDHYNSLWSSSNCIGQREVREWLSKLWNGKPGIRDLVWKGACLALNAAKWSECMKEICAVHEFHSPGEDEIFPVGTGSNPVYLVADCAIKLYVEGGLEAGLHALGTELEFYNLLGKLQSTLKNHIPEVLASGFVFLENDSYAVVPWDGKVVPDVVARCNIIQDSALKADYPFGIWSRKQFEYQKAGMSLYESVTSGECSRVWPYIVTKRCNGKIFAELKDILPWDELLNLASFLGKQLRNLHLLPVPSLGKNVELPSGKAEDIIPAQCELFFRTLNRRKKDVSSRLTKWGDPIPSKLIEKVDEYIPMDFTDFLKMFKDGNGISEVCNCTWIHSDVMDDNIVMEPSLISSYSGEQNKESGSATNGSINCSNENKGVRTWCPSRILDFSDLSLGDPLCDIIPIHLDVFRGNPELLIRYLESYELPLRKASLDKSLDKGYKLRRVSYRAMCYCILHEENVLGAIFSTWKELRTAKSWEEVEETVWGVLNDYPR